MVKYENGKYVWRKWDHKEWQGLTDTEIDEIADETDKVFATSIFWVKAFANAIEAKLKEKNA